MATPAGGARVLHAVQPVPASGPELLNDGSRPTDPDKLLREHESDVLASFFALADASEQVEPTEIKWKRDNGMVVCFHLRPLREPEVQEARRKAATYMKVPALGNAPVETSLDESRYKSYLILAATTPADRAVAWENHDLWKRLNVINAADCIDKLLLAGEKQRVVAKINEISGYRSLEENVDLAKN